MLAKKFLDVFGKLELSNSVKNNLRNANVDKVHVFSRENKMNIILSYNNIINEKYLCDFKTDIMKNFPVINDVDIDILYKVEDKTTEEKINGYWDNILFDINKKSPMCYHLLKSGKKSFKNEILTINVGYNSSFLFRAKKIDYFIKDILRKRFNINISVVFKNLDFENNEKNKFNRAEYIKQEIVKLQNAPSSPSSNQTDTNKGLVFENQKIRKTKRVNVKFSDFEDTYSTVKDSIIEGETVVLNGRIISVEERETKSGKILLSVDITDLTDSVTFKMFLKPEEYTDEIKGMLKPKNYVKIKGKVQFDDFTKELNIMVSNLCKGVEPEIRHDNSLLKRVELHLHTQMSMMDGISSCSSYIERAAKWGHKAIAITDHGVVQAFPEAMDAAKKYGVKILYGVEAYIVNDLGAIVQSSKGQGLDDEYVIFDIETTGLKKETDKIIEIGAVKIKNGQVIDKFSEFINPNEKLSDKIIELTGINDEMLKDAETEDIILPKFVKFIDNSVLVAHNANFDVGFIRHWAKNNRVNIHNTVVDTLELSKFLFPQLSRYKLDIVAKHLSVSLENHHRAVDDAKATAEIFLKCIPILREKGISKLDEINILASNSIDIKKLKTYHAVILVKNQKGLRNLYELISKSHIDYFFRRPRIPKSEYIKLKEGLIIGTACEAGEFFKAVFENKPDDVIEELVNFYDYLEIQPIGNNEFMVRDGIVNSIDELKEINRRIVEIGEKYNKLVVATCDAHFLEPQDEIYRRIIQASEGFKDVDNQAPLYYRTTEEMLNEFDYLGKEKAEEIVITNTNKIAEMIEDVKPIPDETFPPKIDGAEEQLVEITTKKAKSIYGENLPDIVKNRLEKELNSIIKNGFAVLYIIAQKLVWDSNDHGYIVGSRGSVGSSFVATMAGITEVNPLSPHYICSECKYSDFESDEVIANLGNSGCDLPDKICPVCGAKLKKDGHDIPFETFLGFNGDKEPDIDLNFSGEYQQQAHAYTEVLFGKGHVFKAGTIGTVAEKTAYGYVRKYTEERELSIRSAEMNRLKFGCVGIKRTTGQHPGGLMVVPRDNSIYEFCPVQRPANDSDSSVTTTHFDYHSISGRLLKLDLLGHDVPTMLRMFKDITGFDPLDTPLDDKDTMSLFTSPKALGVTEEQINCNTGTLGLPEFGTRFVRQMLMDTKPTTFSELVRISGLSHGTGVWLENAQELIKNKVATLKEVIPTRDDIMVYLIIKGVENKTAFTIMEKVRKGKGLSEEDEEVMRNSNVPNWYIDSCKKIKYMFPKGHAVAYVTNTFRIGYFKINYPEAFYAATFSVKAEDFDYLIMCDGPKTVKENIDKINSLGKDASTKDKNTLTTLELVYEMYARGLKFVPMNLYESDALKFKVTKEGLMPPLCTVQGLGGNAAQNIVEARKEGKFFTVEEFRERTKVSKSVIDLLEKNGVLDGIPKTNQMTLF